jgi:hypothetical protein
MSLKDSIALLTSTYLPFDLAVRGMELDAKEVTVLQHLATYFPYVPTKKSTE